jgi:adenylate cyclase
MGEQRVQRKLAAMLAADVVGDSRPVEANETDTLAAFKKHLTELIEPSIKENRGRLVKTMGDGVLAEFASAVDAVLCARSIQEGMGERNAEVPEDRKILFRIGVNVGDIVIDGDDLQGDGVNIAARLEGIAEPGGICISGTVYDQVHGKLDLGFSDLGEQEVKNIARPVRAYKVTAVRHAPKQTVRKTTRWKKTEITVVLTALLAVAGGLTWWQPWMPDVEPASIDKMLFKLPDKPSIAVLPFTNMSGAADQEYFADGITEDIITDISKISGIFVVARNPTFTYKGKAVKVRQIAEDFGVR